jgi:hypothetical protein
MERARISAEDMREAAAFVEAAQAIDAAMDKGEAVSNDVLKAARLALEIAAVVYYARPSSANERARRKKRSSSGTRPNQLSPGARGEPPLARVDIGPLREALSTREARTLHRDVIAIRNKIVAHAELRYFPVRMVKAFLPPRLVAQWLLTPSTNR